jgi:hypothetical protein
MKRRHFLFFFILALGLVDGASAFYNANIQGQLQAFWSYSYSDPIYFILKNQPVTHPSCNPAFFVIPGTIPVDRRKMMYARLALAYVTQESLNIGYDNTGDCADGYIQAYRVG